MRGLSFVVSALGLACVSAAAAAPRAPVVVELFTAQGCAGCPQADKILQQVATRPGVIALTLPVDYWDYLGWADTFAKPEFSARQRAYADRLKVREIYTPEAVVDGRVEASALDEDRLDTLIGSAAGDLAHGPKIALKAGASSVRVTPGAATVPGRAEVWLMRYDPGEALVRVKTGDNRGKLVSQRYVVRELKRLGSYGGGVRRYALPAPSEPGLGTVVVVQAAKGGRILAAARV